MNKILAFREKEILEALLSCRKVIMSKEVWSESSSSTTQAFPTRARRGGDDKEDAGDIDKISKAKAEAQEAYMLVMETQTQAEATLVTLPA
jgi:hypothetical protein